MPAIDRSGGWLTYLGDHSQRRARIHLYQTFHGLQALDLCGSIFGTTNAFENTLERRVFQRGVNDNAQRDSVLGHVVHDHLGQQQHEIEINIHAARD